MIKFKAAVCFLCIVLLSACSKDSVDPAPQTDGFLFFKLTHGSTTRELHSIITPIDNIDGLVYNWITRNDSAYLQIFSQLMGTTGNPNYGFSMAVAKKGNELIGNYSEKGYSFLIAMDELTIKPGTVTITVTTDGRNTKYGHYIEGNFTMILTKTSDTSYNEPGQGSFRLKEF